jgi:hypothetical protein
MFTSGVAGARRARRRVATANHHRAIALPQRLGGERLKKGGIGKPRRLRRQKPASIARAI